VQDHVIGFRRSRAIAEAESVRRAAWLATCEYLRAAVGLTKHNPFLAAAREKVGDLADFYVLADWLDERGVRHFLRLYLPVVPAGSGYGS
jgi:hypothetical protein